MFFLGKEQSNGASEAGQVSQPVRFCEPGLGDLSKLTTPAYFWGVKLTFVVVTFFGHVQCLRFVIARIFWSCSNLSLVIFIWSCERASYEAFLMTKVLIINNHFKFNSTINPQLSLAENFLLK